MLQQVIWVLENKHYNHKVDAEHSVTSSLGIKAGFQHADFSASADFFACADFSAYPHMNFHHNADC